MLDQNRPIGALVKTTLVDFPERVACALFLQGCNLRCPYCQNRDLVIGTWNDYEAVSFAQVVAHLEKRKHVINGFVISGGEPLMSPFLQDLILYAKKNGYAVKIDTNGMFPIKLQKLFEIPHHNETTAYPPDFIALDVKTSPQRYGELLADKPTETAAKRVAEHIMESINIVTKLPAHKREFRTVLVPGLVDEAEIRIIAQLLPHDASWQFAQFRGKNCLNTTYNALTPYSEKKALELVKIAQNFIPSAQLR